MAWSICLSFKTHTREKRTVFLCVLEKEEEEEEEKEEERKESKGSREG